MYLHKLEKDEKTAFLSLAKKLAEIDDSKIDDQEKYMLQYMCNEMGLDWEDVEAGPFDEDKVAKVFFREEARRILVLEAVGICFSNGKMDDKQQALLKGLAGRLDLGEDFTAKAKAVVEKQIAVMEEFDRLIAAE